MKKLISMILVLLIFLTVSVALAEDTGIQIIGGPETEAAVVSLDDFKVGDTVKIEGYGEVTLTASSWANRIEKYDEDNWVTTYKGWNWGGVQYYDAGTEAIYLRLQLDILNTQKEPFNYYDGFADIICTYDNEYQFGGWVRQHVNSTYTDDYYGDHTFVTLNDTDSGWTTPMFYRDQFSVVITLPNDILKNATSKDDPKPLTVSFNLGENEFTYIYRKQ